ncbi:phage portal protein [Crenobacter cavernae]|uniref:Phage portal protein n=1 Tax=Crenobacter cavernae TaxID=2290923 RepID=A0A345Y6S5_9NEIS|nr:phage portal protein [Crenobacter cavernae]AXK39627.1 phage portal protein [Crenobacter cavernae]
MNWIKRLFGSKPTPPPEVHKRGFSAAQASRLTASWSASPTTVNQDLQRGLKALRARSRDLARNNDYARSFVRMAVRNIVGPEGFGLQVQAPRPDGTIDEQDSNYIEAAFWRWAKRGSCEVTGQHSFLTLCRVLVETLARDGEVLIRRVKGRGPFGYQLQLIDPSLLDEALNSQLSEQKRIVMGVEVDEWGAAQAYHLRQPSSYGPLHKRIPADEIWHVFLPLEIGQQRGVPWMTTGMLRLNMLAGYEEAAVTAARVGAAKMGFFTQSEDAPDGHGIGTADTAGNLITDAEPGTFEALPAGWDFKSFDPDYPHALYGQFVKSCLRGISAGLGVSYNGLASDLEGVNYSSIRAGLLEERDEWMALQSWLIDAVLSPLYSEWLPLAMLSGQLNLPMAKLAKFDNARWQGRRWAWVDPLKDMQASVLAIENGLSTWTDVLTGMGVDPQDFRRRFERDLDEWGPLLARIKQMNTPAKAGVSASGGNDAKDE